MAISKTELTKEIHFKTSRSGGKGGQHINKVSSKVELIFDLFASSLFNSEEKALLSNKLASKLDSEGLLHVVCQESRSQHLNKEMAINKTVLILEKGLEVNKPRKATRVPKSENVKRLNLKSIQAIKKEGRRKPDLD